MSVFTIPMLILFGFDLVFMSLFYIATLIKRMTVVLLF